MFTIQEKGKKFSWSRYASRIWSNSWPQVCTLLSNRSSHCWPCEKRKGLHVCVCVYDGIVQQWYNGRKKSLPFISPLLFTITPALSAMDNTHTHTLDMHWGVRGAPFYILYHMDTRHATCIPSKYSTVPSFLLYGFLCRTMTASNTIGHEKDHSPRLAPQRPPPHTL